MVRNGDSHAFSTRRAGIPPQHISVRTLLPPNRVSARGFARNLGESNERQNRVFSHLHRTTRSGLSLSNASAGNSCCTGLSTRDRHRPGSPLLDTFTVQGQMQLFRGKALPRNVRWTPAGSAGRHLRASSERKAAISRQILPMQWLWKCASRDPGPLASLPESRHRCRNGRYEQSPEGNLPNGP